MVTRNIYFCYVVMLILFCYALGETEGGPDGFLNQYGFKCKYIWDM